MKKQCLNCGKLVDGNLICCPDCKGELIDISASKTYLNEGQINQIEKRIWVRVRKTIFGSVSVFSILSLGFLIWSIYDGYQKAYDKAVDKFEKELISKIEDEFETERIKKTVAGVASDEAKQLLQKQVEPAINEFKAELESNVKEISQFAEFSTLLAFAENDDREAFYKLRDISEIGSKYSGLANKAVQRITDEMESVLIFSIKFKWDKLDIDPSKLTLPEFINLYESTHDRYKPFLLNYLWNNENFNKYDKIRFLVKVLKEDKSLKAVHKACNLMNKESDVGKNILAYEMYIEWWNANKNNYIQSGDNIETDG